MTSGVAYAVKVLRSEREEFERQQGWAIKKMDSQEQPPVREDDAALDNQETSPVEVEYAPVIFAQDAYKHVISFDLLTGKVKTLLNPIDLFSGGIALYYIGIKSSVNQYIQFLRRQ